MYRYKFVIYLMIMFALTACRKELHNEKEIYLNTFENTGPGSSEGLVIHTYNGNKMAGNYNNGGFKIEIGEAGSHDYIKVSFDLYIHDYWDGNNTGNKEVEAGPDLWAMLVDNEYIINTSFSNTVCNVIYCLQQSYPDNYPMQNDPQKGAENTTLPGLCANGGISTRYHVEKLIKHSKGTISLEFKDLLKQSNVVDAKCDESWSLDNLKISTLNMN